MVLYFSATGNTRYIAELIAKKLDDESLDLTERIKSGDHSVIRSKKPFVVCTPIYICEMPLFFIDFLKKLRFAGNRKIYFVFTSGGGYGGTAGWRAKTIVTAKKMLFMGYAELKMPNNYVVSDRYAANDKDEILYRIENSKYRAEQIALNIRCGKPLKVRPVLLLEKAIILPFTPIWAKFKQPSAPFHVSDKCVGCGKCASVCPLNNIAIKDKKPVWNAPCAHCMACICNCPTGAIDYGNITQNKEKYNIKHYIGMLK